MDKTIYNIEHRTKLGKAALTNPDLPIDFIRDIFIALEQDRSLAEPFILEEHPVIANELASEAI